MKHELVVVVHTQKKSNKLSKERWEECIEGKSSRRKIFKARKRSVRRNQRQNHEEETEEDTVTEKVHQGESRNGIVINDLCI